jgi:hypothetical protein
MGKWKWVVRNIFPARQRNHSEKYTTEWKKIIISVKKATTS